MNLEYKIKIFKKEYSLLDILAVLAMVSVGVVIRSFLFSFVSGDYTEFLQKWTNILSNEGFLSLGDSWYNYTPLYMYVLLIISKLFAYPLTGIKIFSCIFDLLLAIAAARVSKNLRPESNPLICFGIVWFAPTVISNSAMWGQCDSIYTFFIVLTLLYMLKENSFKSMLFFALAFSIKFQSVFFAPIVILLFFLKKIRFRDLFLIPLVYILQIIPIWAAGRPLKSCILIYLEQSRGKNGCLSVNYPNIYHLIMNDAYVDLFSGTGILFTVCVLLVLMYYVLKKCYKIGIDKTILLETTLAVGSIIVFLLPAMRERYSYMVDIIAILYGLTVPKKLHIPVLRILISYIAYTTYYVHGPYFSYEVLALVGIYLIYDSVSTLIKTISEREKAISQ